MKNYTDSLTTRENASFRERERGWRKPREDRSTKMLHFRWLGAEGHPTGFLSCGRNKILVNRLDSAMTRKFYSPLPPLRAMVLPRDVAAFGLSLPCYRRQPADRITLILKYCSLDGVFVRRHREDSLARRPVPRNTYPEGIRRSNAPLMRIHSLRKGGGGRN